MSATTALTLSTKAANAIKPPAKKSEIIEALAIRKHATLVEQANKDKAAYVAAKTELFRLTCMHPKAGSVTPVATNGYIYFNSSKPHVTISIPNLDVYETEFTPEMKKQAAIIKRIEGSGSLHVPELRDIRRSIRDAMTGELTTPAARVQALLSDPSTVKALDKTLNRLEEAANKSIAA